MTSPSDPSTPRASQPVPPVPRPSHPLRGAPPSVASAVSVARMQQIDAEAIGTIGIPRLLLMEHAGVAIARAVQGLLPTSAASVVVCAGTGFNGGDGLAAARHLHEQGSAVHVLLAGSVDRLQEEPAVYAAILQRLRVAIWECGRPEWPSTGVPDAAERLMTQCDVIVDALLGIGAHGPVREPIRSLIACMNRSTKPIVSADVPSGLDADTGQVQGLAVQAAVTVTFGLPKRGCYLAEGPSHVGSLIVDSLSIPRQLLRVS